MKANRPSAITRLKIELARRFPGAVSLVTEEAITVLERAGISALDVRTLHRLVPDLDLREIFGDVSRLSMADVRQILNATKVPYVDAELLQKAARDASEAKIEDEPAEREDDQVTQPEHEEKAEDEQEQETQPEPETVADATPPAATKPEKKSEPKIEAAATPRARIAAWPPKPLEPEVVEVEAEELAPRTHIYRLDRTPSEALVIHCGDPRFQSAFRRFITEELGFQNYTPVIIGGGLHAFGSQSLRPKNLKVLWEQIKFFVRHRGLKKIIFINHEDCQWYARMIGYRSPVDLPVLGRVDLQTAATKIAEDFMGVDVRSFYAALDGDRIVFEEM